MLILKWKFASWKCLLPWGNSLGLIISCWKICLWAWQVYKGKFTWFLFFVKMKRICLKKNNKGFLGTLVHSLETWTFFFFQIIDNFPIWSHFFSFFGGVYFFPLQVVWMWGGDICASSGHLLFVVIAHFGMRSLELLPMQRVHIQCLIKWWCGRKELSL